MGNEFFFRIGCNSCCVRNMIRTQRKYLEVDFIFSIKIQKK